MIAINDISTDDHLKISNNEFNFERINYLLEMLYDYKELDSTRYYFDDLKKVVATSKDDIINLYFNYNGTNKITICMSMIKDFKLKKCKLCHKNSDVVIMGKVSEDSNIFDHYKRERIYKSKDKHLVLNELNKRLSKIEELKAFESNSFEIGSLSNVYQAYNTSNFDLFEFNVQLDENIGTNENTYYVIDSNAKINSKPYIKKLRRKNNYKISYPLVYEHVRERTTYCD